ncbi:hypothetical protein PDQ75_25015 [Bacillus cereus group sp. Bc015]|uniref:hypothetical protein n=1 Tax=Bacillus cereus group sp. Bc015 TaxID=3018123 RepID=UPI0022E2DA6A|nr:hypothetical protein [Bacillus cereus group sp. Bc015]MDA2738418.1 hypothetical protein [Bacillus cereus group sp. Bc015]
MGIIEALTLLFITLKLTGFIDWSWWLVLLPEIIAIILYLIVVIIAGVCTGKAVKYTLKKRK